MGIVGATVRGLNREQLLSAFAPPDREQIASVPAAMENLEVRMGHVMWW